VGVSVGAVVSAAVVLSPLPAGVQAVRRVARRRAAERRRMRMDFMGGSFREGNKFILIIQKKFVFVNAYWVYIANKLAC
jgi:hypothetical protein